MDKQDSINKLINKIIDNKINNLLTVINKNYPEKFKKEYIEIELNYIKNNINLVSTINKINLYSTKEKKENKAKKDNKVDNINRCCGRIWNDSIFYKQTMKKVNELPKQFKVIDFKDIDIDKFNNNYILGLQCKNKKINDSNYCKLHSTHLIHGDFKNLPSKELCYHFIKDGNYL